MYGYCQTDEVAKNLERIYERLDQLASKVEAHMAGEAGEVRRVLDEWGRRELPRLLAERRRQESR